MLEDISGQEDEYKNLLEDKNALDMEISVYKKLMESEEERLGIKTGNQKCLPSQLYIALTNIT